MKIKFGLLGCGRIGQRHAEHILAHPEAELAAAYDIKQDRAHAFANDFNTITVKNLTEFFERKDIDIVSICTPNGLHFEGTTKVLESGKHALVEKPMALKKEHCEHMIQTAMKFNKQLYVVKQNRFNPPIVALKKLIDEDKLGEVYQVVVNCFWNRNDDYYDTSDWKGTKELDGGTLFTQFSHFVDIVFYLFGDIEQPSGIISNRYLSDKIEFEDTGSFSFKLKNNAVGSLNYTISSYGQNMEGSITIFAQNGTIKIGGQYLNALEYQKTDGFDITDLPESNASNNYGKYQGSMSNHDKIIDNVVQVLNGRETIMTNAMEGLKVVAMIENFYANARRV